MTPSTLDFPHRRLLEGYAEKYRLALPDRQRAFRTGDLTGRHAGSSIEYQDRKDYVPGDDPRHVDWRAYARNDRLTVKLYRQEISPLVDLVADTSSSMAVSEGKWTAVTDLTYFFWLLARRLSATVRLFALGERLERIEDPLALRALGDTPREDPLPLIAGSPLTRPGGIKIVVSDFLFPFRPTDLVAYLGGADRLLLVQVLTAFEDDPAQAGQVRLEDAETHATLDLALDRATIEGYKRRLENLRADLDRQMRLRGGALASVRDDQPPETMIGALARAGMVEA